MTRPALKKDLPSGPLFLAGGNSLLQRLGVAPGDDFASRLTAVRLRQGAALCEPGTQSGALYFPTTAVVSLMACTFETSIVVAAIGSEGVVGVPAFMGSVSGAIQWIVQVDGAALRCEAADFEALIRGSSAAEGVLRRYEYSVMIEAVQAAACASAHRLEQRCARTLLTTRDRAATDRLQMTHELVASMLSVRRAGVTSALRGFDDRQLVKCGRGTIEIIDGAGLEAAACECYAMVRTASASLLALAPAA